MPNRLNSLMPTFARHEGRWTGTYTHMTPDQKVIDHYRVHITAELPDEGPVDFRLHTHNVWPDGREQRGIYEARFSGGKLLFEQQLIGSLWDIDDVSSYLRFSFEHDPSITVFEMLNISADGQNRARTWHWFRDQKLFQITLTDEWRP